MVKTIAILIFLIITSANLLAQKTILDSISIGDTVAVKERKHSPTKATIMSMAVPGLGQVYNKKYWKLPIIYGGIGTALYFGFSNKKSFNDFKTAYTYRTDGDASTVDEYEGVLSDSGLLSNVEYHQRNKDLSFIIAGLLYVFNIVDAAVDAHLYNFPKNDKLSFNLQPSLDLTYNQQVSTGLKLVIKL